MNVNIANQGMYRMRSTVLGKARGNIRIANDAVEGYVIYVGVDELPDLTADPDGFSISLPVQAAVDLPSSGTTDFYAIVRKRNKYNLESQNQQAQIITIDDGGVEELGDLTAPTVAQLVTANDDKFLVKALYSGYNNDTNPADKWRIYIKADTPPVVGVDAYTTEGNIAGQGGILSGIVGPYPTGNRTYYLAVTVYRSEDDEESVASTNSITLDEDPSTPESVESGYASVD